MNSKNSQAKIVSSESEQLILVDRDDREIGTLSKRDCHDGDGVLHRAFSLFIFNSAGALLLQKRASDKPLWPGYWSNSCCSHPRAGESMAEAVSRRLEQELGISADLHFVYKFVYRARYDTNRSEHELCWVYAGISDQAVSANPTEISDWRFGSADAIDAELETTGDAFTPWFRLEWNALRGEHRDTLARILQLP